ncbi:MAG: hypothetical protein KBT12_05130 [Bacteroidales bacterium]|nr:hypothetical protein [Candidatus Physcousia equi]
MKHLLMMLCLGMLTLACTKKENEVKVFSETARLRTGDNTKHTELKGVVNRHLRQEANDSLATDSAAIPIACYEWDHEYQAKTKIEEENGDEYELRVYITLLEPRGNEYEGGLVLYIDEENFVEATIRGHAEGNHISIFYVESEQNTTDDIFKDGDKLVDFALENGEYTASWHTPMHPFVNNFTTIAIY